MTDKKIQSLKRRKEIQAEIAAHKKLKLKLQKENLKRKKELAKIEIELSKLVNEYDEKLKENKKQSTKRHLNKTGVLTKKVIPYLLTVGSLYVCFNSTSATPIKTDEVQTYMKYMKELESNGKYIVNEQVEIFSNRQNIVTYQGKWKYNEETKEYEREIRNYRVGILNKFLVEGIVEKNEISSLESIFGEPESTMKQKSNEVSEDELSSEATLKAIIFGKDRTQVIMVDESELRNAFTTILYFTLCYFIGTTLDEKIFENGKLKDMLEKIGKKYPELDLTPLENEIKSKQLKSIELRKRRVM